MGKLPFDARHLVDEVLIVDPPERSVQWLALLDGDYRQVERSRLLDLGAGELVERIDGRLPNDGRLRSARRFELAMPRECRSGAELDHAACRIGVLRMKRVSRASS